MPFFSLSGSDFVEMFVGVGAARVRSLFAQAEAKAPCLIFIDELDALGKARGTGGPGNHDERDQTLNQLLVEMDGFDSNRGHHPDRRDQPPRDARRRPGPARPVRPPGRRRPARHHRPRAHPQGPRQARSPLDDEINLRQIAAMTSGFVGADLANLVNEAALLAARKGKTKVGRVEFQEGVERVIAGPEKKQRVLRHDEKLRIAYHEAGHALVARSLPEHRPGPQGLDPRPRQRRRSATRCTAPRTTASSTPRAGSRTRSARLLGGTIAEEIVYGEVSDGATSDLQRATSIARKMVAEFGMSPTLGRVSYQTEGRSPFLPGGGANDYAWSQQTAREIDLEVRRVLDEAQQATRDILTRRRAALEEITRLLIERESIDAAELQAAIDRHPAAWIRFLAPHGHRSRNHAVGPV